MDTLLGIIGSLILLILSWMGFSMRSMGKRIDELNEKKADHADMKEVSANITKILDKVTDLQVENARWQGRAESQKLNSRDKS